MWAFLVTLAFTLYMTGMIWSMQVFEYPLFALVGPKEFPSYHAAHNRSLPFFVILPSLLAFGSAVVLFWKPSCAKTARIYNKKSILFQYFPVSWPYNWDVKDKDCGLALLYECFTMRCLIGKKKSIMQKICQRSHGPSGDTNKMKHSSTNLQQAEAGQLARRQALLARGPAFWLVAYALGVTIMGNNIPAPLYPLYQSFWHFSTGVLTIIFAVVAVGVFPALLFLGPLSDQRGRRPVLLIGLALATVATLVFIFAQGVAWLIVARLLQGVAFGAMSGTATATLAELEPRGNAQRAALAATITIVSSQASAPLLSGLLAQYAPWPTVLVYVVLLVLLLPALVGVVGIPETVTVKAGERQLSPRFAIPASMRRQFMLASVAVFSAFGVVGLISSLGPSFASTILHAQNHAVGGLVVFALLGTSALAQLLCRAWPLRRLLVLGPILLTLGLVLIVFALPTYTLVAFLLGTMCAGLGQGLTYLGSQEFVGSVATANERGEVFSAFNMVVYLGASLVALGVGFGAGLLGLYQATVAVVVVIGVLGLGAALASARTRMLAS